MALTQNERISICAVFDGRLVFYSEKCLPISRILRRFLAMRGGQQPFCRDQRSATLMASGSRVQRRLPRVLFYVCRITAEYSPILCEPETILSRWFRSYFCNIGGLFETATVWHVLRVGIFASFSVPVRDDGIRVFWDWAFSQLDCWNIIVDFFLI